MSDTGTDLDGFELDNSPGGAELATIQDVMRTDIDAYFRDDAMQARYLDLVASRDGIPTGRAAPEHPWRQPADQAVMEIPASVVADWKQKPGYFEPALERVQDTIFGMLANIGDRGLATDLAVSFEVLPENARAAVYQEIALGVPTFVKIADEAELQDFKKLGCAEFLGAWGSDAPRRVAIVYERYNRLLGNMLPQAAQEFHRWFWAITQNERRSVIWSLSGAADA